MNRQLSNTEILEKVIKKAWDDVVKIEHQAYYDGGGLEVHYEDGDYDFYGGEIQLIFDHDFAKAFWREEDICSMCERKHTIKGDCDYGNGNDMMLWQFHLSKMVLSEDPISYLATFLDE